MDIYRSVRPTLLIFVNSVHPTQFLFFRTEDRKEIARHVSKVHGIEVDEEVNIG